MLLAPRPLLPACKAKSSPNALQISRSAAAVRQRGQKMTAQASAGQTPMVLALDFDGVVCDSIGESSATAWTASEKLWPDIFSKDEVQAKRAQVMQQMEVVRPVVETGYENLVQIRCLVEGVDTNSILQDWHTILPQYMDKWGLDRSELVDLFGGARDDMIKTNLKEWLGQNRIYPGVSEALQKAVSDHEVYIVTTKQARFTETLLKDMAQVPFQADRIFSQAESGRPKTEVLALLQQRHPSAAGLHFVEDKLGTLNKPFIALAESTKKLRQVQNQQGLLLIRAAGGGKVCKEGDLKHWNLYLVDWGYNTEAERREAEHNSRIHVIANSQFSSLLANGNIS